MTDFFQVVGFDPLLVEAPPGGGGGSGSYDAAGSAAAAQTTAQAFATSAVSAAVAQEVARANAAYDAAGAAATAGTAAQTYSDAKSLTAVAATRTTAGTLVANQHNPVDCTSGSLSFALPTGKPAGALLSVERIDFASANTCTVTGSIRGVGSSSITLLAPSGSVGSHEAVVFLADSSGSWWPVAGHKTKSWLDATYDAAGAAAAVQGAALQKSSNLSDVSNAATARTNLGLGTAATQPTSAFDAAGAAATASAAAAAAQATANAAQPAQLTTQAKTDYAKLTPWFAALANRTAARANVVVMGASIVEGYPVPNYNRTVGQYMSTLLKARFPTPGVTGGRGYIGIPTSAVAGTGWPLVFTGGAFDDLNGGAKHRRWYANAAGNKVVDTLAAPVTSFDIALELSSLGAANGGYYKIDGGTAVPFSTYNATTALQKLHVASPATTSIEVGWNATGGGYIILDGIIEYNGDESAGVQVHNCGHSGYTTAQWTTDYATTGGWLQSIAALNPHLLIMNDFGNNDASTGGGNITAATFKTNLQTLISTIRGGGISCPIVLGANYDFTAGISTNQAWSLYVAAMQQIAAADSTVSFVDHSARMPATSGNPYSLYYTDLVHGNTNGNAYQFIAETLVKAISPY